MNRLLCGSALLLSAAVPGCRSPAPGADWVAAFGYAEAEVHPVAILEFGCPGVPVRIGSTRLVLPFDTGNMVGLSVSSERFDQLGLEAGARYDRVDSAGEPIATLRVADAVEVSVLGQDLGPTPVYELDHPSLPGLAGPLLLEGGHFTLDYGSRRIGVGHGPLPDSIAGFESVPLVRSSRHPRLILVRGTIEGRAALFELDTGKSRTVLHPDLAAELSLERGPRGVAIHDLRIGSLSFEVPSAKEVDQSAIDPSLPEPILAGVGSDLLSRFVWTVDYDAGLLWIPGPPAGSMR